MGGRGGRELSLHSTTYSDYTHACMMIPFILRKSLAMSFCFDLGKEVRWLRVESWVPGGGGSSLPRVMTLALTPTHIIDYHYLAAIGISEPYMTALRGR